MPASRAKPRPLRQKIKSPAALAAALRRLPARGRRVVFTNGCFDLLHKGHVDYLERARRLGSHLIVAVNSDDSVRRLKGPARPVNPLADRLEVLAALESVDFVTWFDADTPLEVIVRLQPALIVKGGDWKPERIVGGREARAWGGRVRSLAFVEGRSTTAIIERSGKSCRFRPGRRPR
jgi:rfaE bifunctional protein nucleotidyltransferase chain/domain